MGHYLPTDQNTKVLQLTPAVIAKAVTVSSSIGTSFQITFGTSSTILRCYANSQDVYLKWGTATVTSSNFDEVIPAGQIVDLVIPKQLPTNFTYAACNVIQVAATATITVIEK